MCGIAAAFWSHVTFIDLTRACDLCRQSFRSECGSAAALCNDVICYSCLQSSLSACGSAAAPWRSSLAAAWVTSSGSSIPTHSLEAAGRSVVGAKMAGVRVSQGVASVDGLGSGVPEVQ